MQLVGFVVEVVADHTKDAFSSDPANRGKLLNTGVWGWSRHPNVTVTISILIPIPVPVPIPIPIITPPSIADTITIAA